MPRDYMLSMMGAYELNEWFAWLRIENQIKKGKSLEPQSDANISQGMDAFVNKHRK